MITLKELQYVDAWATKIPMPGYEYGKSVMEQMEECYKAYNRLYKQKEYNLIFSNGEEINFSILEGNLCHMLGIDYSNIKNDYFDNYRQNVLGLGKKFSSINLLEAILENSDKVIQNDNDSTVKEKIINYYKSQVKCEIFKKLSDFSRFNYAAINCGPGDSKYDCFDSKKIFIPSNEMTCPYFMMGISSDKQNSQYYVNSLFAPTDVKKHFDDQEVIIPTQIIVSDDNELKRSKATPEEKIALLTMYKNIIREYNIPNRLNIYCDYEDTLNNEANKSKVLIK